MLRTPMIATLAKMKRSAMADPDVRLMLRVKKGDSAAFNALLANHSRNVSQQLYQMTGSREDAEDLTQEVFLRVYRHRKTYKAKAKFVTWLYHIVRNVGRNALRDRRRHPAVPLLSAAQQTTEQEGLTAVLADPRSEHPSGPLERREACLMLMVALRRLDRRQREALELQHFEDLSYADIAYQFALSPQAAKSLLYRARLQLRDALERNGLGE
jgi:RNA polymerase sigma-70 factor, ECF subfamily